MSSNSKVLLELEGNARSSSTSYLGSKLLLSGKDDTSLRSESVNSELPVEKPSTFPVTKSQVLGKVKNFLGTISESNKMLLLGAKENPDDYDIEVLSGKESHYIEMDLMLGIADLHTPEAVAAAESAMASHQPVISVDASSESESDDDKKSDGNNEDRYENDNCSSRFTTKSMFNSDAGKDSSKKSSKNQRSRKRPKIEELC